MLLHAEHHRQVLERVGGAVTLDFAADHAVCALGYGDAHVKAVIVQREHVRTVHLAEEDGGGVQLFGRAEQVDRKMQHITAKVCQHAAVELAVKAGDVRAGAELVELAGALAVIQTGGNYRILRQLRAQPVCDRGGEIHHRLGKDAPFGPRCMEDLLHLSGADGGGLFAQHVLACPQAAQRSIRVQDVWDTEVHDVNVRVFQHFIQLGIHKSLALTKLRRPFTAAGADGGHPISRRLDGMIIDMAQPVGTHDRITKHSCPPSVF